MSEIVEQKTFEDIRHIDEEGNEYWLARELAPLLDYAKWENFETVLHKAITSCISSNIDEGNNFLEIRKMVTIGSGANRHIKDYKLSRYACYLAVQNGDSSKPVIANGQTYFAVQTRLRRISRILITTLVS